jgi:GNAT superfamily N-acetyltransferase/catechol 2,3-dioxygenase-like lactoylglutathione lyase family enzyme
MPGQREVSELTHETTGPAMHLLTIEPILAVRDVAAATAYWRDVLGFGDVWVWGEPPTHGGANQDGVSLQFSLNPALAERAEGQQVWIRVRDVEATYALHQERGAEIVAALEPKPWGVSEYVVRDPDGYRLRFAGSGSGRAASQALPAAVRIEPRLPSWPEMEALIRAVGWESKGDAAPRVLKTALFGAVAVAEGQTVGCAFLTGDNAGFYYVRDVMVHPDWQRRHVGTALMRALMEYLQAHGVEEDLIGLFTGPHLHEFYAQFGFAGPKSGLYGMTRTVRKK